MKREITSLYGDKKNLSCIGCEVSKKQHSAGIQPIYLDEYFNVHQDYELPIPGFMIMATKRHIGSVLDFTNEERDSFMDVVILIRKAMKEVLGIEKVTLVQEETSNDHFHLWFFPHYPWMAEKFSNRIKDIRPIMEYARKNMKTDELFKEVEEAVQKLKQFIDNTANKQE